MFSILRQGFSSQRNRSHLIQHLTTTDTGPSSLEKLTHLIEEEDTFNHTPSTLVLLLLAQKEASQTHPLHSHQSAFELTRRVTNQ